MPVMDTFDPETGRVMEISYVRNDADFTSSEKSWLARVWDFFRR